MGRTRRASGDARGAIACSAIAVGSGGVAYCAIGDQSVDRSVPGEARFVGPMDVSMGVLLIGLAVSAVIGVVGVLLLAWWMRDRRVRRGWAVIALGGSAAAAVSAWTWRVLTASYAVTGSTQIWLAISAAAVAWAVILVGAASYLRSVRDAPASLRGCGYCAQEDNVRFGDVHTVSTNEVRHTLLLQCPRCGWLYTAVAARPDLAEPITEAEARELFPSTW
jgi:hypothetical protein